MSLPRYRCATKNHTRSRRIGPPNVALSSQSLSNPAGAGAPRAFRSSVKLLADMPLVAKLPKNDPVNLLPPSRGTMLTLTPPLDVSAEIAPVSKEISWAAASLSENVDHAAPPEEPIPPSGTPSSWIVMSNAAPP